MPKRLYYRSFKPGEGNINNANRDLDQQVGAFCWCAKLLGARRARYVCRCAGVQTQDAAGWKSWAVGSRQCRKWRQECSRYTVVLIDEKG